MSQFNYDQALNYARQAVRNYFATSKFHYDEYDFDETVSQTMMKVLRYSDKFDSKKGALGGWVYTIAKHCGADYLNMITKARKTEARLVERSTATEDDNIYLTKRDQERVLDTNTPESALVSTENLKKINWALKKLNQRDQIIVNSLIDSRSIKEISQELKMTEGHVRNRICHLRKQLREILSDAY